MKAQLGLATAPTLLCCNLRREHVAFALPQRTHDRIDATLRHARAEGWAIVHAFMQLPRARAPSFGALLGFEPRRHEPVFAADSVEQLSCFIAREFSACGAPVTLIGGVFSKTGLACVLCAQDLGLSLRVISDACFQSALDPVHPGEVLALASAAPPNLTSAEAGGNVIQFQARRP